MSQSMPSPAVDYAAMDERALVARVLDGDHAAFRQVMQRCNQRLFRVAQAVVNDESEAEDVVQEGYVHAYEQLGTFRGEASLLTWMTRIVLNEAYGRLRRRRPTVDLERVEAIQSEAGRVLAFPSRSGSEDPAAAAARAQVCRVLEQAIEALPGPFRVVFVMREIEGCSVEETASALQLVQATVKTRLHRARRLLRASLNDTLSATLADAFPFLGQRCDRMTAAVLARLQASPRRRHPRSSAEG